MTIKKSVLSVTQLNKFVKNYLETELGPIHVEGEISNLSKPSSGHLYFTLKDSTAQIRCVFFKNRHFRFSGSKLDNGQHIVASGSLSLYEARGDYQLIIEQITEAGLGALYQKFEALKSKLASEGLFDAARKKAIPLMPQIIGVITSASGAAIQDILSTLARRFPVAKIILFPSEVQGATASKQLIKALELANEHAECDVLILARGGGSIEDLWAFNDEQLARQIVLSNIPVVTGIGHETDFTIADFVADYRAETPTAAASAVTPSRPDLIVWLDTLALKLIQALSIKIQTFQLTLNHLKHKIASPRQAILSYWQAVDYYEKQLFGEILKIIQKKNYELQVLNTQLHVKNPGVQLQQTHIQLTQLSNRLVQQIKNTVNQSKLHINAIFATLHAVSPLATLDRGYAIASINKKILFTTQQVSPGDNIEVRLARGNLACQITQINEEYME